MKQFCLFPWKEQKTKLRIFLKRKFLYAYVVCNRCLYAKSVMEFQFNKYNLDLTVIIHKITKNDTTYICSTCHSYLKKSHITAQADLWGPAETQT